MISRELNKKSSKIVNSLLEKSQKSQKIMKNDKYCEKVTEFLKTSKNLRKAKKHFNPFYIVVLN